MEEQTVKGALRELKGHALNTWQSLADQELDKAKKNVIELSSHFQHMLDEKKEQVSEKVSRLLSRFNAGFDSAPVEKNFNSTKTKH